MAEPLRHRQTKEAETDMPDLPPPRHIPTLPKAAVAGSPVTNRRSEPVSVVAAAPCQCPVALPPRFCIGTLTFGDNPVLCRGPVFPPPVRSRIGSQQIRRRAVG